MSATLIYVHDPMCSWCYGFSKTHQTLFDQLPADIQVIRLLGGLARDNNEPMPESTQAMVKKNWQNIEQVIPGVQFNYDFWSVCEPKRSTYPACRAVIAAKKQGESYDAPMTQKIQQAYYQQARNPSENETLIALAGEIGLDVGIFSNDLVSDEIQHDLLEEIQTARSIGADSFPNLVLKYNEAYHSIGINYTDAAAMLSQIKRIMEEAAS